MEIIPFPRKNHLLAHLGQLGRGAFRIIDQLFPPGIIEPKMKNMGEREEEEIVTLFKSKNI